MNTDEGRQVDKQMEGADQNMEHINDDEGLIEAEIMQVDTVSEKRKKVAVLKQNRRIVNPLRSPRSRRQPLRDISNKLEDKKNKGKRSINEMEVEVEIAGDEFQVWKKNKHDSGLEFGRKEAEGEGSNPIWTPENK